MSSPKSTTAKSEPGDLADLVFVALGSNLASNNRSSEQLLELALGAVQQLSNQPILRSSVWRSDPVDCPPDSPMFLNAVAAFVPLQGETPVSLLGKLQQIEVDLGRKKSQVHNAPRAIDLDIISFQNEVSALDTLTLPHPAAHRRLFVVAPLSEIAGELVLPGQNKTVQALVAICLDDGQSAVKVASEY